MSRSKKTIVTLCICVLMICNCTLSVCAIEYLYDNDYVTGNAPENFRTPNIVHFVDTEEYESYPYKVRMCSKTTYTGDNYVSVVFCYDTLYSTKPIVFYIDGNGCYLAYSEGAMVGNSAKIKFNDILDVNGYVRNYCTLVSYSSHSSYQITDYSGSVRDASIIEGFYNSEYIFDSLDSAKAYLATGSLDGVVETPYVDELQEDVTQGFNQFQTRRIQDSSIAGGTGVLVTYDIPVDLLKADKEQYIVYELTYSYKLGYGSGTILAQYRNLYESCTITVKDSLSSCSGQRVFDFVELCESANILNDYKLSLVIKSMNEYCIKNGVLYDWSTNVLASACSFPFDSVGDDVVCKVSEMECSVTAYLLTDGVKSKNQYGYVDLVSGQNQSMSVAGDTLDLSGNVVSVGKTLDNSNLPDVEKKMNADGTISYVDVTVNVDAGGVGSAGNVVQNNNVTIPDTINVNIGGTLNSSAGADNVTIEDDDYSLQSITNLVDGAGGFFDDLDTDKNDDGFLSLLGGFFGSIDDDLGNALGAGMGATIIICILRSLLKR